MENASGNQGKNNVKPFQLPSLKEYYKHPSPNKKPETKYFALFFLLLQKIHQDHGPLILHTVLHPKTCVLIRVR